MAHNPHEVAFDYHLGPDDTALEHTASTLTAALDRLEERGTMPDSYTADTQRIPFGRFGDGHLATSLTIDQGFLSATLSFQSKDENRSSFLLKRDIGQDRWWMKGKYTSDEGVLRHLDANWPQQLIDNDPVRRAMLAEEPTFNTVFTLVHGHLQPHAPYLLTEKIYGFNDIRIDDETGECHATTLTLGVKQDQDGFQSVAADITQPYTCNGLPTELHSRIHIDDIGTPSIASWYDHPTTKKQTPVDIKNIPGLCTEFDFMVGELLAEKLPTPTDEA